MKNNEIKAGETQPITKNRRGRPTREEAKARLLSQVAGRIAKEVSPKSKSPRRSFSLLVRFDSATGFDEVYPLYTALKSKRRGVAAAFIRRGILEYCRQFTKQS